MISTHKNMCMWYFQMRNHSSIISRGNKNMHCFSLLVDSSLICLSTQAMLIAMLNFSDNFDALNICICVYIYVYYIQNILIPLKFAYPRVHLQTCTSYDDLMCGKFHNSMAIKYACQSLRIRRFQGSQDAL